MEEKKITRTYTMRIDVELYKKLEEEAVRRRRSVNFIVTSVLASQFLPNITPYNLFITK